MLNKPVNNKNAEAGKGTSAVDTSKFDTSKRDETIVSPTLTTPTPKLKKPALVAVQEKLPDVKDVVNVSAMTFTLLVLLTLANAKSL